MKKLITVLIILTVFGCDAGSLSKDIEKSLDNETELIKIFGNDDVLTRFENKEVICYVYNGYRSTGMSCKFK